MDPSQAQPSFFRLGAKSSAADYSSSESESENDYNLPGLNDDENDFGDFNPRKRRRLGGNNKERAALGIFGSDSEDDKPGSRWKSKTLRSKGVSFVTAAAQDRDAMEEDEEGDKDEDDAKPVLGLGQGRNGQQESDEDEDEDEADEMSRGLGLGSAALNLQAGQTEKTGPQAATLDQASRFRAKTTFSSGGVLGNGFVPSSAKEPVLKEPSSENSTPRNTPQVSAFTSKGKINVKSFAARMMAKMGYVEGQGLGKDGQGRNITIEANLRPQGIGLGAVKEKSEQERQEEKRQAKLRGEVVIDSDEEEKKRKKAKKKSLGGATFSSGGSTPQRPKTKYLTAEELRKIAPGLHIPEAFAPILDMTGPGGKLLTSTSGIMTPTSGAGDSSEVIEARKLARRAQADLMAFSEEWRNLEGRKTWVDLELREKEQEMENLQSDFDRLQLFANVVTEQLVAASEWEETMSCLQTAADHGAADSVMTDIAIAAIHPLIRDSNWDPMTEPSRFTPDLQRLADLFMESGNDDRAVDRWDSAAVEDEGVYRRHHKATTSYETMMYKVWLPRVLSAVRSWDPQNPAPMLSIMESWQDLLPPFVRAQFVDNIARKLETAVSNWNPKKKRGAGQHMPHTWLFPWLQYLPPYHLDPKGTGLVAEIRRKFRHLVEAWEFERGVVPGLAQWEQVLGDQWRKLIMSHVLPSMGRYLRANFRVDPADQEPYLPVLVGVLKWNKMLGETIMAEVLVQDMFPVWSRKLREWLALDEADLAEVADWYGWWRGVLLKDLAGLKPIQAELDKGLRLVNMI
ncbi:G-patch domain-containing protein [Escovopsis weberi]|uniref:G-patch domain-containing protein n=1 Tax=Escovopsis weberi TaxID=150374 RepID=A0A0M8N3V7_ESCWE|nr:G-patch domain-containing protein [Escovopsis weberi]